MPRSDTTRGNTWTLTLKLEDSADLAGYLADPEENPWPLVEDEEVMLQAMRRRFRGARIELPDGGWVNIVDLELTPPEDDEFLTERKFRNRVAGERQATIPRTECPQDAREALGMVLSAWEYVWRTHQPDRGGRTELQDAAYDLEEEGGITREEAQDLESQATIKWTARERLGMLGESH